MLPVAQFLSSQMRAETRRAIEDEELLWAGGNRPAPTPQSTEAPERQVRRTAPWPTGPGSRL